MQAPAIWDWMHLAAAEDEIPWQPFRPGVEIHRLYGDGTAASAALLRYQPGASVPLHVHTGYEHVFVLSGSQTDDRGTHPGGTLVINPPGSRHSVVSPTGCIVLVIWEKPVELCP
jgi:anti-sigma factor ChrR (cupin superfamily)